MLYVWLSPKTFKFPAFNLIVSFCSFYHPCYRRKKFFMCMENILSEFPPSIFNLVFCLLLFLPYFLFAEKNVVSHEIVYPVSETWVSPNSLYCRGPDKAPASAQVEVPNSQRISCLDSSLGRAAACGAGGRRFAPRPWHVCLGALLEDRDDPGQVFL